MMFSVGGVKKAGRLRWVAALLLAALALLLSGCSGKGSWREASRESAQLAPLPADEPRAVVQAYAARVWGWRGWFADHTWIATKAENADEYTVYEVIGWRLRRGGSALRIARDIPDRKWFGGEPSLLLDIRGARAAALLAPVDAAARAYPYAQRYKAFPGPNSNTFTAWVAQQVPALNLHLPLRAIGKDYPLDEGIGAEDTAPAL